MSEAQKNEAELTILGCGSYGAKRSSLVAVLWGGQDIRSVEDLARVAEECKNEAAAKAVEEGRRLWLARGYESDEAVILSAEPKKLEKGPRDARDFTYGTPAIDAAGHELLIFALNH